MLTARADGPPPVEPPHAEAPPPRGLLRPHDGDPGDLIHRRLRPSPGLADVVEHFWWVEWRVPVPRQVQTLPHPSVHLVFETPRHGAELAGVHTRRFERELAGHGRVFGIKFRPACSGALLPGDATRWTDARVPLSRLPLDIDALSTTLVAPHLDLPSAIALAEAWLGPRLRPLPVHAVVLRDLVERMAVDHELLRVEQAASAVGWDVRTLQRRCLRHVGVSPKWLIRRYRLMEAAERLRAVAGGREDLAPSRWRDTLAGLAADLGYCDQSHFSRDFAACVGLSPSRYVAACRRDAAGAAV